MNLNILNSNIYSYCLHHTSDISPELKSLINETYTNAHGAHMSSDKMVIKMLQFFTSLISAKNYVDIGTYTGVSTLAMAEVIDDNATIYTLDRSFQLSLNIAKKHFAKSKHRNKIKLIEGEALDTIHTLPSEIGVAFIDADKLNSQIYFDVLINKLVINGIIIIDDVLWRGDIIKPTDKRSKALALMNKNIAHRDDVDNIILPLRHGLNIVRKTKAISRT